jgi:hypothetical protein
LAKKSVIRQLVAGLLLLVFTFSIAPKQFLHDAIANHKDKLHIPAPGDEQQVSKTGFFCKCDNLVAESPFTDEVQQYSIAAHRAFAEQPPVVLYFFHSSPVFFFGLRGPPVVGNLFAA